MLILIEMELLWKSFLCNGGYLGQLAAHFTVLKFRLLSLDWNIHSQQSLSC